MRDGQPAQPPQRLADTAEVLAPKLARGMLYAVLVAYLVITYLNILTFIRDIPTIIAGMVGVLVIFMLQLLHSNPRMRQATVRVKTLSLGSQALLTFLPLIVFHRGWGGMGSFLAGSFLLILPARWAWTLYGLTGLSMMVYGGIAGMSVVDTVYMGQSTWLSGLVVYGISRLAELVTVLHETRGELARMAVSNERLRFARDLHDLLGYSLSAISLKSELIRRLLPASPDRAREEVSEVLDISRQALADVRLVASGYREMSLVQECASAREVLRAAEVDAALTVSVGELPPAVDTVLATVLREGMTNLLRHSRVRSCTIEAVQEDNTVQLSVVNDGVDPGVATVDPHGGSGLGNLTLRVRAMGGTLSAGLRPDGRFHLVATVPVEAAPEAVGLDIQPLRALRRLSRKVAV
ncbi:sensor histidine kinase [Kitasatospora sp. MMS16-BH015]|uniref:sensor histidine kinase n=1 Tax=Kitasatospora sp. MMS16-BH015 TaxID=2018025 RepID=UPI000CF23CD2|nr:histidine kinase [Kitasatospora sp. MMS16-BH015]